MEKIIILAKGPSWYQCPVTVPEDTEIWGCNGIYHDRKVNRLFVMHDIRLVMVYEDKDFVQQVNELGIPVYTAGSYDVLKNNVPYPVNEVFKEFGAPYFLNVITYMIAYAIMQKPKTIEFYGVDMRSGDEYMVEKSSVEFWLGVAVGRGIKIKVPDESMLLKDQMPSKRLFYGYTPRRRPDGLVNLIPDTDRHCGKKYKLVEVKNG